MGWGAGGWAATCQLSDGGGNGLRHLLFPDLSEAPKEFEIQTKSISVGSEAPSWAGGQSTICRKSGAPSEAAYRPFVSSAPPGDAT